MEIVAGILPQPWLKAQAARDALTRHGEQTRLPGTLIELPGVSGDIQRKVLARFDNLSGVLCVFGQAIRSIEFCVKPQAKAAGRVAETQGAELRRVTWEPEVICPGVEFGRIRIVGDWGPETRAVCLRSELGALLFALGPDGFRSLPDEVPTVWVTAPTKAYARLGFAVNGRFEINTARAELKGDSESNSAIARRIGMASGESLGALFDQSCVDWAAVRERLGLAADLNLHDFWHSLWIGLIGRRVGRQQDAVVALVMELVRASFKRLSDGRVAVPNGLNGPLQSFIATGEVGYELAKDLMVPPVLAVLGGWGRFTANYPARSLVASDIGTILKHADLARPVSLGLAALVAVIDPAQAEPEDAMVLGQLLLLTEENADWKSKDVRERLGRLQFRTEDGGWATAGSLLADGEKQIEPDESLRFALAPLNRRLHRDYCVTKDDEAPALALFLACRERLQAPADVLAQWIVAACTEEDRHAALVYLADGELGETTAERVCGRDWLQSVFQNPAIQTQLSEEQRLRLQRRLASREVLAKGYQAVEDDAWVPPPVRRRIDLATALQNIHAWWSTTDGAERANHYFQNLYPATGVNLQIDPETGRYDRSSWLTLFSLGAFQGMGLTQDAQHRGFIQHCQQRGWWQTFAEIDPKEQPVKWMDIIEEYAEAQHVDEKWTQWISQFPKLYKLRRWMDEYVELFLSIDRFPENASFRLSTLLVPLENPHFQGGGNDARALNRTLKVGGHLVVRELLRYGIIRSRLAVPHAYAPIERIQRLFAGFGAQINRGEEIHALLCEHLGEAKATFNGDYDIPLRIVAADEGLQDIHFR